MMLCQLWLVSDAVCDFLIAGSMLWLVSSQSSPSRRRQAHYDALGQFHQSKNEGVDLTLLGKIVRLIIETNALTGQD